MKKRLIVASIILAYNLIGLIALFGLSRDDPFYWDDNVYLLLFTFPVSIYGFMYRYFESGYPHNVIIIQLVVLAITLLIGDFVTRYIRK